MGAKTTIFVFVLDIYHHSKHQNSHSTYTIHYNNIVHYSIMSGKEKRSSRVTNLKDRPPKVSCQHFNLKKCEDSQCISVVQCGLCHQHYISKECYAKGHHCSICEREEGKTHALFIRQVLHFITCSYDNKI